MKKFLRHFKDKLKHFLQRSVQNKLDKSLMLQAKILSSYNQMRFFNGAV